MIEKRYSAAIGTISFYYKSAGFPEIKDIAEKWKKDTNFYNLIIRRVNSTDFGLQFIYVEEKDISTFYDKYIEPFEEKYELRSDIAYSEDVTIDNLKDHVIIYKMPKELK